MNQATVADVSDVVPIETEPAALPAVQHQRSAITVATPADLLRIAVESGADLDRLEKLMQLQERWEANEARKAFVTAMAAFKREPIEIYKRKHVHFETRDGGSTSYKHAELSDVTDVIAPAMAKHGLSFDWDLHQANGVVTVDCIVTHVMGHSKKVTMTGSPDASGKKNAIQQTASTITYLQRYTLLAATGMSTKDEDDDGAGGADARQDDNAQSQQANGRPAQASQSQTSFYDQKKFDANKDTWRQMVKSGRKTAAAMIKFIESKGAKLTVDQQNTIDSWSHEND